MREQYYVDGNTVRKLNTAPKQTPQRVPKVQPEKKQERKVSTRAKKNQARALSIQKGQAFLLGIATILTLSACVYMLNLQATITSQNKNITTLEEKLNMLVDNNEATDSRLNGQVDLSEIYRIATEELGMVYASKGQILSYEETNPDYVRQYKDVPEMR